MFPCFGWDALIPPPACSLLIIELLFSRCPASSFFRYTCSIGPGWVMHYWLVPCLSPFHPCGTIVDINPSSNVSISILSPNVAPWGSSTSVSYSPSNNTISGESSLSARVLTPVVGTRDHGLRSAYNPCTIPPLCPFWLSSTWVWGGTALPLGRGWLVLGSYCRTVQSHQCR